MTQMLEIEDAHAVKITQGHWEVRIEVEKVDGTIEVLIASADSALTERSAIWLGTPEELRAEVNP